jgi:hypothetical protein
VEDRQREQVTALPRRSACGREQKKGEREKKQEVPPVRGGQRGRGGYVKGEKLLRGFLQKAFV